ncbi:hypothetical protein HK098_002764 [Nowakowskiella sp. JEL0407]|nr:hypothetical protein HK098_002764 [Nowakowskiella sp. JEL0407]
MLSSLSTLSTLVPNRFSEGYTKKRHYNIKDEIGNDLVSISGFTPDESFFSVDYDEMCFIKEATVKPEHPEAHLHNRQVWIVYIRKERKDKQNYNPEVAKQFWEAIKKTIKAEHESLLKHIENFETRNKYILVFERPLGKAIGAELKDSRVLRKFTEKDAASIIRNTLLSLKEMHNKGMIHRHINLETVFTNVNTFDILDKPIVLLNLWPHKYIRADKFGLYFSSPEMVRFLFGNDYDRILYENSHYSELLETWPKEVSEPTDIWSIGCLAYFMLRGYPAFYLCKTVERFVSDIISDRNVFFESEMKNFLSPNAMDFLRKCLTKDSTQRLTVDEALEHQWLNLGGAVDDVNLEELWRKPHFDPGNLWGKSFKSIRSLNGVSRKWWVYKGLRPEKKESDGTSVTTVTNEEEKNINEEQSIEENTSRVVEDESEDEGK